ncbi:sensor histidine kinase [Candidatus Enterococcus leclercqii]|uniref:sensor histidine kinase n=1 Tax=Candidatus Enterococcus leclercqii TaxID=1857218 RepID=UPI00137A9FAE|nr:sensor histidine kinase [Enterococcus sp. CU9D]KAF1290783.1 histidine kinase [Enterococcus sp. CU9D]
MAKWSLLKTLSRFSIRKQLFIVYIPIIFLSTLFIGGNLVYDSTLQLRESYQNLAITDSLRVRSIIFEATKNLSNIAQLMSTDTDLRKLLENHYQNEDEALNAINNYQYIDRTLSQDTSIYQLRVYTSNQTIPDYKYFRKIDKAASDSSWVKTAMKRPDVFWQTAPVDGDTTQLNLLTLYKRLPLPLSSEYAILELKLDYNFLRNRINNSAYEDQLFLNGDPLFYSDTLPDLGTAAIMPYEGSVNENYTAFVDTDDHKRVLVASTTLSLGNDTDRLYIYSIDYDASKNLANNLLKWSSVLILVLLTTLLLIMLFANFFAARVSRLQQAVYHASQEDYDFFGNIAGEDEISKISLDFHTIIQRIKANEEAIFQAQLKEQEFLNQQQQMEYNVLASQINPHFLFNTLETIRMTALKNQDREAADSIKLLSKSMRYTLDNEGRKITTLGAELQAIEIYTRIQKMRFGDRVNLETAVEEGIDADHLQILPLLIQPLIENAITHGLEKLTRPGLILLTVSRNNDILRIEVEDNGVGISPEELDALRKRIADNDLEDSHSIGLRNVNNRIRMYYGRHCGLTITSELGVGTTITLFLKPPHM